MGRIFEKRKTTMFARWNRMAKLFTRVAKDIAIAVKSGGTDPNHNPALRRALQKARAGNMPKDKVDAAIKRAAGQDQKAYEVHLYEGYAPHGIAVLVETATDNVVRTVATPLVTRLATFVRAKAVTVPFVNRGVEALLCPALNIRSLTQTARLSVAPLNARS